MEVEVFGGLEEIFKGKEKEIFGSFLNVHKVDVLESIVCDQTIANSNIVVSRPDLQDQAMNDPDDEHLDEMLESLEKIIQESDEQIQEETNVVQEQATSDLDEDLDEVMESFKKIIQESDEQIHEEINFVSPDLQEQATSDLDEDLDEVMENFIKKSQESDDNILEEINDFDDEALTVETLLEMEQSPVVLDGYNEEQEQEVKEVHHESFPGNNHVGGYFGRSQPIHHEGLLHSHGSNYSRYQNYRQYNSWNSRKMNNYGISGRVTDCYSSWNARNMNDGVSSRITDYPTPHYGVSGRVTDYPTPHYGVSGRVTDYHTPPHYGVSSRVTDYPTPPHYGVFSRVTDYPTPHYGVSTRATDYCTPWNRSVTSTNLNTPGGVLGRSSISSSLSSSSSSTPLDDDYNRPKILLGGHIDISFLKSSTPSSSNGTLHGDRYSSSTSWNNNLHGGTTLGNSYSSSSCSPHYAFLDVLSRGESSFYGGGGCGDGVVGLLSHHSQPNKYSNMLHKVSDSSKKVAPNKIKKKRKRKEVLPPEWESVGRPRKNGKSKGQIDKYYINRKINVRVRSIPALHRYLRSQAN